MFPFKNVGLSLLVSSALTSTALSQSEGEVKVLDLDSLKARCQEISENQQFKPLKVVISCQESFFQWREVSLDKVGTISIENSREVGASFRLKGFEVPYVEEKVSPEPASIKCVTLDQYSIKVPTVDIELSCSELQLVKSLASFCTPYIDERVSQDPHILREEKTGISFSSCVRLAAPTSEEPKGKQCEGVVDPV